MPVSETELDANANRLAVHSNADSLAVEVPGRRGLVPDFIVMTSGSSPTSMTARLGKWELAFPCLWVFISAVSAFDTYLTVRFQEHLAYHEQNPFGLFLLWMADWEPSLLIGAKFLGSTLVLGILSALYLHNRRVGISVTLGLAIFQLGLLGYLILL